MRQSFSIPSAGLGPVILTVFALLWATPALVAQGPAPTAPSVAAPISGLMSPDQSPLFATLEKAPRPQAHKGDIGDPSAQGTCIANCWDGTTRTCGGTTCNVVDSSCSTGQRGYCWGSDTGYNYCPPCSCYATASCGTGYSLFCSGTSECFGIDNCYVYCDGNYYWCPNALQCPV